ncbi:MAG: BatD family protein [candidate division FCPU426 bacterium]
MKRKWLSLMHGCLLACLLAAGGSAVASAADDEKQPPSPAWGGQPVKRTWGSPDSQEEFEEQVRERAEEGGELLTAPLAVDEEPTAAPTSASTPVPAPAVRTPLIKQYIYKPKDSPPPAPEPEEGVELDTAPLAGSEGPEQRVISLQARLDRNPVHLDESFALVVEILAADLDRLPPVKPPRLPELNLINTYQSQTRIVRQGTGWWLKTQGFVYLARRPGRFTLPGISMTAGGRTYRTPNLEIEVEGSRSGQSYRSPLSGERYQQGAIVPGAPDIGHLGEQTGGAESEFFARLSAAKAYVNQEIILTVHLTYTVGERTSVTYRPPEAAGFLIEELPEEKAEELVSGARQRSVAHKYRMALFAVRPGALTIGPAQAIFTDAGSSRTLQTEPLVVDITALPPDPEAPDAGGLVGRFQLEPDVLEMPRVGSPARVSLRLSGQGNLRAAPEPAWSVPSGCRLFLENRQDELQPQAEGLFGTRTYAYWLICDQPGALRLGPARIRYFDLGRKQWSEATAELPVLTVAPKPEAAAVKVSSAAARKLSLNPDRSSTRPLRPAPPWKLATLGFWAWQGIGPALLGMLWWGRRQRERARAEASTLRVRRAYAQARKALRLLKGYIRRREDQKFYDGVARTAAEYLSAKLNQPSVFVNLDRLPDFFGPYHVPPELLSRFRIALTAIEYVRYAAVVLPNKDMESLRQDLENAVEQFEKFWQSRQRSQPRPPLAPWAGLLLVAVCAQAAWGQEEELRRLRGATLAEQGDLAGAEAEYRAILNLGVTDPEVFYNLGNVYLRQGKVGPAVLAYERGLRLAPRDPDLKHNLKQAEELVAQMSEAPQPRDPGWGGGLYRAATANELAVMASVFYYLMLLLVGLRGWWPKKFGRFLWGVWLGAGLAVAFGLWSAARQFEPRWHKQGVVLVAGASVHSRPYTQAETLYALPEGTRVRVRAEEEAWVEIDFAPHQQGWISRSAVGWIE